MEDLGVLLREDEVLIHPLIIGELACGNLHNRRVTLTLLKSLPKCRVATDQEACHIVETKNLYGCGIGFLDVHLLGACILTGCPLWTNDKALLTAARELGLSFT